MLSIIIPFYNEAESLPVLIDQLVKTIKNLKEKTEVILVDDGSEENLEFRIQNLEWQFKNQNYKIIFLSHRKRLGKGRALLTGFNASKGNIIIFMDADLQDDPKEIPKFLEKIKEGYDLVNGWRKKRRDPLSKTLPSAIFNFLLLKLILRSKFHDVNCGFKAMKRKVLEEINLYGDNYRFLPIMAERAGFKTTEIEVIHHQRRYGKSKYTFIRLFFGFFDTLTTYFISTFSEKPLHFFGPVGIVSFLFGFIITSYLIIERIFFHHLLYRRPLFLIGILLIIVGIQIVMTGILGELIVYLNQKQKNS